MVQIFVHIRPGDRAGKACYELFECQTTTRIKELKQMVEEFGKTSGRCSVPWETQELVFNGERCENDKCLADYSINRDFIKQVTGFIVNPREPGKRFVEGVLVPY